MEGHAKRRAAGAAGQARVSHQAITRPTIQCKKATLRAQPVRRHRGRLFLFCRIARILWLMAANTQPKSWGMPNQFPLGVSLLIRPSNRRTLRLNDGSNFNRSSPDQVQGRLCARRWVFSCYRATPATFAHDFLPHAQERCGSEPALDPDPCLLIAFFLPRSIPRNIPKTTPTQQTFLSSSRRRPGSSDFDVAVDTGESKAEALDPGLRRDDEYVRRRAFSVS